MFKRLVFALLVAAVLLPSMGCCFRRGCSKCNMGDSLPPPPPPSNYCPG